MLNPHTTERMSAAGNRFFDKIQYLRRMTPCWGREALEVKSKGDRGFELSRSDALPNLLLSWNAGTVKTGTWIERSKPRQTCSNTFYLQKRTRFCAVVVLVLLVYRRWRKLSKGVVTCCPNVTCRAISLSSSWSIPKQQIQVQYTAWSSPSQWGVPPKKVDVYGLQVAGFGLDLTDAVSPGRANQWCHN